MSADIPIFILKFFESGNLNKYNANKNSTNKNEDISWWMFITFKIKSFLPYSGCFHY